MNDEDWGPWVEHDGKSCPLPIGTLVQMVFQSFNHKDRFYTKTGDVLGGRSWYWKYWGKQVNGHVLTRIVRYRVKRPNALKELIKIAEHPEKELENVE